VRSLNHQQPTGCFFRPIPESVAQARRWIRTIATFAEQASLPVAAFTCEDLEVVISELATNAVRAAVAINRQGAAWSYRLSITAQPDTLHIDVTDPSPAIPVIREPDPLAGLDAFAESGRGLPMLREYGFTWHTLQHYRWGSKTIRYQRLTDQAF
jgi:anti-sigma regulatory factor (Ser/Thr protein kinase)